MPNRLRVDTTAGHRLSLRLSHLMREYGNSDGRQRDKPLGQRRNVRGNDKQGHGERSGANRKQQRHLVAKGIGVAAFACCGPTGKLLSELDLAGAQCQDQNSESANDCIRCAAPDRDEGHEQVHVQQQLNWKAYQHIQNEIVAAGGRESLPESHYRRGVKKLTDDDDHSSGEGQIRHDDDGHACGGQSGQVPERNCSGRDWALRVGDPVVVLVTDVVEHPHDQQVGEEGYRHYSQHRNRASRNTISSERGEKADPSCAESRGVHARQDRWVPVHYKV